MFLKIYLDADNSSKVEIKNNFPGSLKRLAINVLDKI
jgi:hypothetical protein